MLCICLRKTNLDTQLILIDATDEISKDIFLSKSEIDAIKQRKISEAGNLESQLKLKIGEATIRKEDTISSNIIWGCTAHKVQGLSLAERVVSFDLEKRKSFNQGKLYVALGRISSMSEMYLIGSYNNAALKVKKKKKKEYESK